MTWQNVGRLTKKGIHDLEQEEHAGMQDGNRFYEIYQNMVQHINLFQVPRMCVYQCKVNVQAKLPSYVIKHHAKQVVEV